MKYIFEKIAFIFLLFAIVSCSNSNNHDVDDPTPEPEEDILTVITDPIALEEAVKLINIPVTFERYEEMANKAAFSADWLKKRMEHQYTFVAELPSPELSGEALSATEVIFDNNFAYITFNRWGDVHEGGFGVIDLTYSDFDGPKMLSEALFDNMDVNAIGLEKGQGSTRKVWLAGSSKDGGELVEISIIGGIIQKDYRHVKLSDLFDGTTASANSVAVTDKYIYVTSGKSFGGLFCLNRETLEKEWVLEFDNAKSVAIDQNKDNPTKFVALASRPASSTLYVGDVGTDPNDGVTSFDIGAIAHQNVDNTDFRGKSTIYYDEDDNLCWVSMGKYGLKGFDVNTGSASFTSPDAMLLNGNVNSVTHDEDYLYMALGQDGLCIAGREDVEDIILPFVYWDDEEEVAASANFIQDYNDEWIFIAKGGGGFKILHKSIITIEDEGVTVVEHDSDGKPDDLEDPDFDVCEDLVNTVKLVLPESVDARENRPELFQHEIREIILQEDADVYVTFVFEGAGYKNTLGYYYYPEDNPPRSVSDLERVIIFPNASMQNSGGSLVEGNTMKLLGKHDAGTVIGFFLIAYGWNGVKVTDGLETHYTYPGYNRDLLQQHLIFYDPDCTTTIMAFEDIYYPSSDVDYNDAIFTISTDPPSALDTDGLYNITEDDKK